MKKLFYLSVALSLFLTQGLNGQTTATLIKKVEAQPGKLIIPYSKYKLPNGLTVLINEDHSDPIVHVEVTYHVGSNRETAKRTGFAHFFEHMMFQGSQNVADEEHFKIVQGAGGEMNGTTNKDRTNYFETVPSNYLETALWLEADRMGFLLPAFTKKKFEVQRATVKNEKDQRYGEGYGALAEVQDETIYPFGHPYSWQTIGYVDDLNEADSSDLRNFFIKWYGPNNAILVISGDVNTEATIKMVEKYFGAINRGPEVPPLPKRPVTLDETKNVTILSKVSFPLSSITFPSVPSYHPDEAALDLLGALLSDGKNSDIYKTFVDPEYCVQVGSFNSSQEVAGEFNFQIVSYPMAAGGITDKQIRDSLAVALGRFEAKGIKEEDLARIKQAFIASYYGIIETVASKASVMTTYEMLMPNKDFTLQDDLDRYSKVTKEDIIRVYRKYIKDKNYACVNILPHPRYEQDRTFKVPPYESINQYAKVKPDLSAYQGLTFVVPVDPADFNRKNHPAIPAAKAIEVPNFFKVNYENGVKIIGTRSIETPRVYFTINIRGGHRFESGKVKNGTAAMLADALNESSTTTKSVDLDNKLQAIGSQLGFSAGANSINCMVSCYKDKITETMTILEEKLFNPAFDSKEFKTNKKAQLESISSNNISPVSFGSKSFFGMLYGADNPIGVQPLSDYKAASGISVDDLKNYYNNFMSSNLTTVTVVGDVDEALITEKLAFLKKMPNKNLTMPVYNKFPETSGTQIYLVNADYAKQTNLMMGYRTIPYDMEGDFYKSSIMNFALGGNFNSRLNLNIREDKGWTYGIRSGFSSMGTENPGYYMVSAGIKTSATDSAITEILTEIKKYKEVGITDEELAFTKQSLIGNDALKYESPSDKLGFLSQIIILNLDRNYNEKRADIVKNITKEQINEYAKKMLSTDNLIIMCVGDDVLIKEKLEKLGLGKVKVIKM